MDVWAIKTDLQLRSKTLAHCTRQKKCNLLIIVCHCPTLQPGIPMAKTKVRTSTDKSWSSWTRWLKDKIKYNVMTTTRCPECGEDINEGTAWPAGLSQHTGKSKCKRMQKERRNSRKKAQWCFTTRRVRGAFAWLGDSWLIAKGCQKDQAGHTDCRGRQWNIDVCWKHFSHPLPTDY